MAESEVRAIRPDELDALLELYAHLHPDDAPLPQRPELEKLWAEICANPWLHYLAIERDGRFLASCTLSVIPNLTRGARPYGLIENVITLADFRRRGLATRVLRCALDLAWKRDCYKVMLFTSSKDPGIFRFYERAGFEWGDKTGFVTRP